MENNRRLLDDIKKLAIAGKFTGYQCRTSFHKFCPGFNTDDKGERYDCNCPCHGRDERSESSKKGD